MTMIRQVVIAGALLALAGCGSKVPLPLASDTPSGLPTNAPSRPDAGAVDLKADGLVVPANGSRGELDVPFGSNRAAVEKTLAEALGAIKERTANPECPAGEMQMTRYTGLTLDFQSDKLVGWYATAPYVPTETRATLLARSDISLVKNSTLANQFTIGKPGGPTISGEFDGAKPDSHVIVMWAGISCIFK